MNNGLRPQMYGSEGVSMMAKIMEIIAKETKGKSYHTYKYSYTHVGFDDIQKEMKKICS